MGGGEKLRQGGLNPVAEIDVDAGGGVSFLFHSRRGLTAKCLIAPRLKIPANRTRVRLKAGEMAKLFAGFLKRSNVV